METTTEKPSLKDRVLAHKSEIIYAASTLTTAVVCVAINNKIWRTHTMVEGRRIVEIIEKQGKFLTDEIDGVQYVIHKAPKS